MKNYIIVLLLIFFNCKKTSSTLDKSKAEGTFKYLTEDILKTKTPKELRLIRNEVYAYKGYVFKDSDLQLYFESQKWYKPNKDLILDLTKEEDIYIDKIKFFENKIDQKRNCINKLSESNSDFFPLKSKDLLNKNDKYKKLLEIKNNNINEIVYGNLCAGGYVWDIKCSGIIEYQLMFYNCVDNDPFIKIAIIKNENDIDFIELYGSSLFGEDTIDNYYDIDFSLSRDYLEVYKIYKTLADDATEENPFKTREVKREIIKYRLTTRGLVKL